MYRYRISFISAAQKRRQIIKRRATYIKTRSKYLPSWLLAWLWMQLWGWARFMHYREVRRDTIAQAKAWSFLWNRRESPEPVACSYCGWAGPRRRALHPTYDADACPDCGAEVEGHGTN